VFDYHPIRFLDFMGDLQEILKLLLIRMFAEYQFYHLSQYSLLHCIKLSKSKTKQGVIYRLSFLFSFEFSYIYILTSSLESTNDIVNQKYLSAKSKSVHFG
jgi:hypothetical protein